MDPTFNDIPFEVFIDYILPLLSIVEIGMLAMVGKSWKSMADEQEVWKILYLRTIRADILDTSVHIGPKWARRKYLRNCQPVDSKSIYVPFKPFSPNATVWCNDSYQFLNRNAGCSCMPSEFKKTLKSWNEVRKDGIDTDDFPFLSDTDSYQSHWYRAKNTKEYSDYVINEWKKYNAEKGLSTVSLCQDPNHYDFDTLGMPNGCRNYKSFKKITLKKLKTQIKHESKKTEKTMNSRKKKLEQAKRIMQQLELEFQEAELSHNKKTNAIDKLDVTIHSL